jgi:ribulose-5-phosphate 4-epimerase/fuculose-1-phosphate aldolase
MAVATPISRKTPSRTSDAESEARLNLAALYRLADHYGWDDLIYNHLAARVPGEDCFLMKRHSEMFDEVTASSLAKLPLRPNGKYPGFDEDVNPAGYVIHSAILNARPEANYTMHIHTRAGAAVSATRCGVLPVSQDAMRFYNRVSYHEFEGIAINDEECARLARDLGPKNRAMVLYNHGLLTLGPSAAIALSEMRYLFEACETQLMLQSAGQELHLPPADICEHTAALLWSFNERGIDQGEWKAYLRIADRLDSSFRN